MKRVTGLGGIFFKADDSQKLQRWYKEHLGLDAFVLDPASDDTVVFHWREKDHPERLGYTLWAPFREDTRYFQPSEKPFMINFRVDNLEKLLPILQEEGVEIVEGIKELKQGKFAWIMDPDGNKVELWEPRE